MDKRRKKRWAKKDTELAERYDVSRQTITRWKTEGFPRRKNGRTDLQLADAWVAQHKSKNGEIGSKAGYETEIRAQDARRKKRENDEADRLLVKRSEMENSAQKLGINIRVILNRIPLAHGATLGAEAQKKSQAIIDEAILFLEDDPFGLKVPNV